MAKITLINADAESFQGEADIILTDPPYDMDGAKLARILDGVRSDHLILVTTMKQLFEFSAASDWKLSFDFVLDAVVPKQSKAAHQPHYTHQTGVYMTRHGARSRFNRKRRERSDTFDGKGFWPTILRAPRDRMQVHALAKNLTAWTDLLGSFDVESVCDPFAGSGTTGLAAMELGLDCTLVEIDPGLCERMRKTFRFAGFRVAA